MRHQSWASQHSSASTSSPSASVWHTPSFRASPVLSISWKMQVASIICGLLVRALTCSFLPTRRSCGPLVIQSPVHLIGAWITAILGMLDFIVLSLARVGQKELYQLWSPWCTSVLASVDSLQDGCSNWKSFDTNGVDDLETYFSFICANSTSLALFEDRVVPEVFNWAFAGLAGLLLLVTFYQHSCYWISKDRQIQYQQKLAGMLRMSLYC
jgi:hypothetical protein